MKKSFFSFLFFLCVISTYAAEADDSSKISFFINDKRMSIRQIEKGMKSDSIKFVGGFSTTRKALLNYGEIFRFGIIIFKTKDIQNNEK